MNSHLFTPFRIGDLELAIRILIAPMCQYSAEDGSATDWHMIHLGHLALSGAAMMIVEATAVSPQARITPTDLGLYSNANEAALDRVFKAVRRYSPKGCAPTGARGAQGLQRGTVGRRRPDPARSSLGTLDSRA